jgi:hypothetical protein
VRKWDKTCTNPKKAGKVVMVSAIPVLKNSLDVVADRKARTTMKE